jgi:hypothetical protein
MSKPLPALDAWLVANRHRFKPGTFTELLVEHDDHCRYPQGEDCTCISGPDIKIRGFGGTVLSKPTTNERTP